MERLRAQLDALLGSDAFVERMKQVGVEVERKCLDDFVTFDATGAPPLGETDRIAQAAV